MSFYLLCSSALFILLLNVGLSRSEAVLDLSSYTIDEFRSEMENYDSLFVEFYAPYCGHCKSMAKDFEATAKKMQDEDPPVALAKVDCTSGTGTKICKKFNIKGYPHLQLFKQGKPGKTYEGNRISKDFEEWLGKNAKLTSKRFSSYTELDIAIKRADEPVVIAIFTDKDDSLVEMWHTASKAVKDHWTFREIEFFHIFDDYAVGSTSQLRSVGLDDGKLLKTPAIVLHRPKWLENKYEETNIMYQMEENKKQDLAEWVFRKAFGSVLYRTRDNAEELKPPLIVAYYDVDFKGHSVRTHLWRNKLVVASKEHPDVKFAISSSQSFRKQLRRQALEPPKDDERPLIVGYDNFGTLYMMRDEYTRENFARFIVDYKNGDVSPHLRSQEPPEDNDQRNVKITVGGNFNKLVTHNKRDVFIAFYAPWCKHSQELEPVWEELASQLKNEPGIDIVKMDATANEVPTVLEVPLYPTVYFVPKNSNPFYKKAIKYNRGRHIHEFVQYLAEFATDEMRSFHRDGSIRQKSKSEL